jgi:hypothetical protein
MLVIADKLSLPTLFKSKGDIRKGRGRGDRRRRGEVKI